jgi:hypothetical protein
VSCHAFCWKLLNRLCDREQYFSWFKFRGPSLVIQLKRERKINFVVGFHMLFPESEFIERQYWRQFLFLHCSPKERWCEKCHVVLKSSNFAIENVVWKDCVSSVWEKEKVSYIVCPSIYRNKYTCDFHSRIKMWSGKSSKPNCCRF